jgi:hypothetical protein
MKDPAAGMHFRFRHPYSQHIFKEMTLAAGSRLGPYEILAPIGSAGMGEVWDTGHSSGPRCGDQKPGRVDSDAICLFQAYKPMNSTGEQHMTPLDEKMKEIFAKQGIGDGQLNTQAHGAGSAS